MIEPNQQPANPHPDTNAYILWGFILAGLGFVCCCCGPLFSIPAIILGAIAYSRGDQRGLWVIIAGAAALVLCGGANIFGIASGNYNQWIPNGPQNLPGPWHTT